MKPSDSSDLVKIIHGCKKQDAKSQKALFMLFSEALFATCVRYTGDENAAKDVLQESFLAVFQYIHTYDEQKGNILPWMTKICINQALKHIKSKYVLLDLHDSYPADLPYPEPTPHELMQIEELFHLIKKLPEPYRTVFNLFEIEGYSHHEIAELLQIKEGSSRSILSRAKKLLTQHLTHFQLKGI